ncbi:hypothetical protein N6H18_11205 [Reichenbachiella agarivorans]|uniref:Glycosyl transferase family 28 C-terminal domain-containing protein n=1 Tax=Reichenbachiella agarivorans TaxID=2979464 RepID=A0ABY6CK87_9BACT|nr:glycosyltransferase family protein [Reichenbachiella agarivorans]UXP30918.1 hypothetical protein N6H18_11205 [Reichenbachiella agarivorans]
MRIAYFIHGRGRGHSSRALTLLPRLRAEGCECMVYAGDTAYEVLKGFDSVKRIKSIVPGSSFFLFVYRIWQDYRVLKQQRPHLLISDGDAPCTYAAKFLGIKVLSIGHALIFPYCENPIELPKVGLRKENFKVRVATLCSHYKVAVHFTNIQPKNENTFVVRPDIFFDSTAISDQGYLLSYFRDGNGQELIVELINRGLKIKNFGNPIDLHGVENFAPDNLAFRKCLMGATGVVGSAGSNLIFESIAMNKPLLLQYREDDFEQAANVKYVEHEGLGLGLISNRLSTDRVQDYLLLLNKSKKSTNSLGVIPALSDIVVRILKEEFNSQGFEKMV